MIEHMTQHWLVRHATDNWERWSHHFWIAAGVTVGCGWPMRKEGFVAVSFLMLAVYIYRESQDFRRHRAKAEEEDDPRAYFWSFAVLDSIGGLIGPALVLALALAFWRW